MAEQKKGNPFGVHRVIEPENCLPQAASRLNNDFSVHYDNEILCDVEMLNIDAASFAAIKERAKNDPSRVTEIMLDIVKLSGKHQNPWTGSGGMFIGTVNRIGEAIKNTVDLAVGDRIASLVSLTLTPLRIDKIKKIHLQQDQVEIDGQAVLFEHSVWVKLPTDIPPPLALAMLDVAGAAPQVARIVKSGDTVAILGGLGKSGLLCAYQARKSAGATGRVISVDYQPLVDAAPPPFIDQTVIGHADQPLELWQEITDLTEGRLCDVVINCVSGKNCEMGAIMITKSHGTVYFFSMTTEFTKAALGAEGIGKDINMLIGNGYCEGHAEMTLNIIRESSYLHDLYTKRYCK